MLLRRRRLWFVLLAGLVLACAVWAWAIGDALFGNREKGITPEFSRVLRSQILLKDRRWLVVIPATPGSQASAIQTTPAAGNRGNDQLGIVTGAEMMDFPIEFEGTAQSPLTRVGPQESARP